MGILLRDGFPFGWGARSDPNGRLPYDDRGHFEVPGGPATLEKVFTDYRATMPEARRDFLERYRFVDFALKVVGVGSVGTRCFILVLEGRDENDPLILQAKEATRRSLSRTSRRAGTRTTPSASSSASSSCRRRPTSISVGHAVPAAGTTLRQLWDMKGSVDMTTLRPVGLAYYGGLCGWSLARAHACTGDAVAIAAYLGAGDQFDGAIADFSEAYADINERDHEAYVAAIEAGTVSLPTAS